MTIVRNPRLYLLAFVAASLVASATQTTAQQQSQQSGARDAAIRKCVHEAHQQYPTPSDDTIQQRYLWYVNCMTTAGFQP
jgi:hypothetical protein